MTRAMSEAVSLPNQQSIKFWILFTSTVFIYIKHIETS